MKADIVQTQSWRYKTIVVIKRQQQTTISHKLFDTRSLHYCIQAVCLVFRYLLQIKHSAFCVHFLVYFVQGALSFETLSGKNTTDIFNDKHVILIYV